jgi:archaellum biogenesis ATPase FlaH
MITRMEDVIAAEILGGNLEYAERVLPYLEPSFFQRTERAVFATIQGFVKTYHACPSKDTMKAEIRGNDANAAREWMATITPGRSDNPKWLLDQTEKFIQERRQHVFTDRLITGGWATPEEFQNASRFSFDDSATVGYDFFQNAGSLYDYVTDPEFKIPFDIETLNNWTDGGVTRGSINIVLAPTSGGKSLVMCHLAASYMRQGKRVIYITLEIGQELTANRIWANLMDRSTKDIKTFSKMQYEAEMQALRARITGELVIKHYPSYSAGANTFRSFLRELKHKKGWEADVMFIDYLGLCRSSTSGKNANSYEKGAAVANELRGLASEQNVVLWTAVQTNRSGYNNSSIGLEQTSESYAINSAASNMFGVAPDQQLPDDILHVTLVKQQNDGFMGAKEMCLGVNKSKMKIFDIDEATVRTQKAYLVRNYGTSSQPTATVKSKQTAAEKVKAKTPQFANAVGLEEAS